MAALRRESAARLRQTQGGAAFCAVEGQRLTQQRHDTATRTSGSILARSVPWQEMTVYCICTRTASMVAEGLVSHASRPAVAFPTPQLLWSAGPDSDSLPAWRVGCRGPVKTLSLFCLAPCWHSAKCLGAAVTGPRLPIQRCAHCQFMSIRHHHATCAKRQLLCYTSV